MSGAVKTFVDTKIAGKKVVVFSKGSCPFCRMAKNVLDKYNLSDEDYEIIEIGNRSDCSEIQNYLHQKTGGRTVPRVFIKGNFIGGGSETEAFHKNGKLKALLA